MDKHKNATGKDLSADGLIKAYNDHVNLSPHSEKLTDTFIRASTAIRSRVLSIPEVAESIVVMEDLFQTKSPWRSLYIMQAAMDKSQSREYIKWVFLGVADECRSGELSPESVTVDFLKGKGEKIGHTSVLIYKKQVKDHMLRHHATVLGIEEQAREAMRDKLDNFMCYRVSVRPFAEPDGAQDSIAAIDLRWMKGWKPSSSIFLQLVESMCYGVSFNGTIKNAAKNSKSMTEFLEYTSVKERLTQIAEMLVKEKADVDARGSQDGVQAAQNDLLGASGSKEKQERSVIVAHNFQGVAIVSSPTCIFACVRISYITFRA